MDWKRNKVVGMVAFVLILAAAGVLVWWATNQPPAYRTIYFQCESTGKVFDIVASPDNPEYVETYINYEPMQAAPCKFDDKNDAYLVRKNAQGEWVKISG